MPQLHLAIFTAKLLNDAGTWKVLLAPQADSHWQTFTDGWAYRLTPDEFGHYVEVRVPARVVHEGCTFRLTARAVLRGGPGSAWDEVNGYLCSLPLAAVSKFYLEVEATPLPGPNQPLGMPAEIQPRGGGHVHVKDAGGDG